MESEIELTEGRGKIGRRYWRVDRAIDRGWKLVARRVAAIATRQLHPFLDLHAMPHPHPSLSREYLLSNRFHFERRRTFFQKDSLDLLSKEAPSRSTGGHPFDWKNWRKGERKRKNQDLIR